MIACCIYIQYCHAGRSELCKSEERSLSSWSKVTVTRLSQFWRPLLPRQPHPVRVKARVPGVLQPLSLGRPNWDCFRYFIVSNAMQTYYTAKETRRTKPCPSLRAKHLLPVRANGAEPPHITLAPDTSVLRIPRSSCLALRPKIATTTKVH